MLEHCYADTRLHWLGDVILALCHTGMRIGELCSLKWSDIDANLKNIHLTDTSRGGTKVGQEKRTTKSHQSRCIYIMQSLRELLQTITRPANGRVFQGPCGGRLSKNTVLNTLIKKVIKPLASRFPSSDGELGFADGRVHSFRHYFCSNCSDKGIPREMVMQMVGHQDSAMVAHDYHARESVIENILGAEQCTSIDMTERVARKEQKAS